MTLWYEAKHFLSSATAISMDALHVLAGALLFLAFSLAFRTAVTSARPWLGVLAVTLLNEAIDLWVEQWPSLGMQLGESAKDIVVTMLIPTLILLTARRVPRLYAPRRSPAAKD